jgi:hypothetical protein
VWRKKQAVLFREEVPRATPRYYELVARPICLRDMLDKVVQFQYRAVSELLADMDLMACNAETYNTARSPIAIDARSLQASLKLALTHDLEQLGPDKDEYTVLERVIKKK